MINFIDTHAHIYDEYYDSIDDVIIQSCKKGVDCIINSGVDTKSNREVLNLASQNKNMFCAIGIHPEYASIYKKEDLKFLEDNLSNNKVVALGEIGLDYHYTTDNKEEQKSLFEYQLSLAEKYNLPVIVHSRDATLDTIETLKKYKVKGVIHSFSGSLEVANIYIKIDAIIVDTISLDRPELVSLGEINFQKEQQIDEEKINKVVDSLVNKIA